MTEFDIAGEFASVVVGEEKDDSDVVQGKVISREDTTYTVSIQGDSAGTPLIRSLVPLVANDTIWLVKKGTFVLAVSHQDKGWRKVGTSGEPAFLNAWSNYETTETTHFHAKFRKVNGVVHIEGLVKGGTWLAPVFTLPAGYRPGKYLHRMSIGYDAACGLRVEANGNVLLGAPTPPSNLWASIGVSFIAEG